MELRIRLLEQMLANFQAQHKHALDTWSALESKSQVLITVSGVFLAGIFTFVDHLTGLNQAPSALLIAALVLLVASVLAGLAVFRLEAFPEPPQGTKTEPGLTALVDSSNTEKLFEDLKLFVLDQTDAWKESIQRTKLLNARKAKCFMFGQACLGLAITATALFTVSLIRR